MGLVSNYGFKGPNCISPSLQFYFDKRFMTPEKIPEPSQNFGLQRDALRSKEILECVRENWFFMADQEKEEFLVQFGCGGFQVFFSIWTYSTNTFKKFFSLIFPFTPSHAS